MLFLTFQQGETLIIGGATVKVEKLIQSRFTNTLKVTLGVQVDHMIPITRLTRDGKPLPKRMRSPT